MDVMQIVLNKFSMKSSKYSQSYFTQQIRIEPSEEWLSNIEDQTIDQNTPMIRD